MCTYAPAAALILLPTAYVYACLQAVFVSITRQLQRVENHTRTPIVSSLRDTIAGSAVIRITGQTPAFRRAYDRTSTVTCVRPWRPQHLKRGLESDWML